MRLKLEVNGEVREGESLLYVLCERLGFPGSKNACEQGECGSCSVYLDGVLVCSCLVLAGQAEDSEVITVEGIAERGALHPVQEAFVEAGGVQCGFCTPGFIVATHDLLQRNPKPTDAEVREALAGNLCRCTVDEEIEHAAARAGLAALARSGCSTSVDHHYVFPRGAGDLLAAEIEAAREIKLRFHPTRGSMDLGESEGGLPPDSVVEDLDEILLASEDAIDRFHDASFDSMLRIALAPCSPFSVTSRLMSEVAELARSRDVRLHTHLAETEDEEEFCLQKFGVRPAEYLEGLGWLGEDVWLAHCVHLDDQEVRRFGVTGTGVAHCPSSNARLGAGIAPVAALVAAGAPVGLGVDGAASNESGELGPEVKGALHLARLRAGASALSARAALALATRGGARCLGRSAEIGSLEPGKLADVAVWGLEGLGRAGIQDPVAALAL